MVPAHPETPIVIPLPINVSKFNRAQLVADPPYGDHCQWDVYYQKPDGDGNSAHYPLAECVGFIA